MSTLFECCSCFENKPDEEQILIDHNPLCTVCFNRGPKADFERALKSETAHPVKLGQTVLDINNFKPFFTPAFLFDYNIKMEEYAVPPKNRLYCKCEQFLGNKATEKEAGNATVPCDICSTPEISVQSCTTCSVSFPGEVASHTCAIEEDDNAFDELTRGVDYQICPNESCSTKVQLSEACNHMTCGLCKTEFCYSCGEVYTEDHFDVSTCRQYPLPTDGHDDYSDEYDDDDYIEFAELAEEILGPGALQQFPEYRRDGAGLDAALGQALRADDSINTILSFVEDDLWTLHAISLPDRVGQQWDDVRELLQLLHKDIDVYVRDIWRAHPDDPRTMAPGDNHPEKYERILELATLTEEYFAKGDLRAGMLNTYESEMNMIRHILECHKLARTGDLGDLRDVQAARDAIRYALEDDIAYARAAYRIVGPEALVRFDEFRHGEQNQTGDMGREIRSSLMRLQLNPYIGDSDKLDTIQRRIESYEGQQWEDLRELVNLLRHDNVIYLQTIRGCYVNPRPADEYKRILDLNLSIQMASYNIESGQVGNEEIDFVNARYQFACEELTHIIACHELARNEDFNAIYRLRLDRYFEAERQEDAQRQLDRRLEL